MSKLEEARLITKAVECCAPGIKPEIACLVVAMRNIIDHLEVQEATKPPEPVEWREGDLARWEKGESVIQDRVFCTQGTSLWLEGFDFAVPAAECTLIKRAGE